MTAAIQELMQQTGVRFGTSGARGLATQLTDLVAYAYTRGFLQYLEHCGELTVPGTPVAVAGDLRPSTGRIMAAALRAAADLGYQPVNCGRIPSPALALAGFAGGFPTVMVTGSHIPADRNGIKFNKCSGEVLKSDEAGICGQQVLIPEGLFDAAVHFAPGAAPVVGPEDTTAVQRYVARYLEFFPASCLHGLRLGVYQHSAVGRDVLVKILRGLGAEVTPLGRSDTFIPVDTEAIRPEDVALARQWAATQPFDALVSADGDSDRPLISDERGEWIRGDVAGILCARFLGADSVSTPVSCNSAVELCGWFQEVKRTKIGSPFVVSSLLDAARRGLNCVVGYEANGGFLLNSPLHRDGRTLRALPTRDAVLPMISLLLLARAEGRTLSQLVSTLPTRFTASGLVKECPVEKSQALLARYDTGEDAADRTALAADFTGLGPVTDIDRTDGVRVTFANGEVVHLRPSGNAPEFRCYNEAGSEARVHELGAAALAVVTRLAR
jgi:phosphomannomutase